MRGSYACERQTMCKHVNISIRHFINIHLPPSFPLKSGIFFSYFYLKSGIFHFGVAGGDER